MELTKLRVAGRHVARKIVIQAYAFWLSKNAENAFGYSVFG